MRSLIKNIYYFGSLADGFKVYPNNANFENIFSTYYNNSETDWILNVNNNNQSVLYTYVRYGILTSLNGGRTGSCFGIAIDFDNSYFSDFEIFRTLIIEKIIAILLHEETLLSKLPNSEMIAFKSYNLSEVSTYLDNMTSRINEFINSKYLNYILPSHNIKISDNRTFMGLNNSSPNEVIKEMFELSGSIKLSPKLPLETKTSSQKEEDYKNDIQKRLDDALEANGKLEKQYRNAKLEIENQNLIIKKYEAEIQKFKTKKKGTKVTKETWSTSEDEIPLISNQEDSESRENKGIKTFLKSPIMLGIIALLVLFILIKLATSQSKETEQNQTTNSTSENGSFTNPTDFSTEQNCTYDINSNPQKWIYNGNSLNTSVGLATFIADGCNKGSCYEWIEGLKNNIEYSNSRDITFGSIKSYTNIIFMLPQNVQFRGASGFTKQN